jgi:ribosomal-protein-alanine N-acetyltransferase
VDRAPRRGPLVAVGLRPWALSDAGELTALYATARAELAAGAPWRGPAWFTPAAQRERISATVDDDSVEGFVITASGAIAGHVVLDEIRRDLFQSAGIGYWVAPAQRGRGIATLAVGLAVIHAFTRFGLHRIHATVDLENQASWRVLERNDFQRVGVIRGFTLVGGRWHDHYLYQRTADGVETGGDPPAVAGRPLSLDGGTAPPGLDDEPPPA